MAVCFVYRLRTVSVYCYIVFLRLDNILTVQVPVQRLVFIFLYEIKPDGNN